MECEADPIGKNMISNWCLHKGQHTIEFTELSWHDIYSRVHLAAVPRCRIPWQFITWIFHCVLAAHAHTIFGLPIFLDTIIACSVIWPPSDCTMVRIGNLLIRRAFQILDTICGDIGFESDQIFSTDSSINFSHTFRNSNFNGHNNKSTTMLSGGCKDLYDFQASILASVYPFCCSVL